MNSNNLMLDLSQGNIAFDYEEDMYFESMSSYLAVDSNKEKDSGKFTIFHLNIRSYSANFLEFLAWAGKSVQAFDVLVFTEAYLDSYPVLVNIPGFDIVYTEKHLNKNDGIVIYIKSEHRHSSSEVVFHFATSMYIRLYCGDTTLDILSIYRNARGNITSFSDELVNFLESKKGVTSFL